jgi:peptidyl-prolyl cis-trans isomerase C
MLRTLPVVASLVLFSFAVPGCSGSGTSATPKPTKAQNTSDIERGGKKGGKKGKQKASDLPEVPNEPVAFVNDTPIPKAAFSAIYDLKRKKYDDRDRVMPRNADRRYRRSIVERLIYQELLRQAAAKDGVAHDAAKLAERVSRQKNGIKDWQGHLGRRGESDASLEAIYIKELLEVAILEKRGTLTVKPEDLQAEYDKFRDSFDKDAPRIRASHILFKVGPKRIEGKPPSKPTEDDKKQWEADALARAQAIMPAVRAEGADFAALAREHSEGPGARKGGDLDIISADRMPKEFSEVAFKLAPGEISDPVITKFGVQIIKVHERFEPGLLPLSAVEPQLRERLELVKLREGRQQLRDQLWESAKIVNKMDEWLGPDPRPRTRRPRGHGPHGKPAKSGLTAKSVDAKKPTDAQPDPQTGGANAEGTVKATPPPVVGKPAKAP